MTAVLDPFPVASVPITISFVRLADNVFVFCPINMELFELVLLLFEASLFPAF